MDRRDLIKLGATSASLAMLSPLFYWQEALGAAPDRLSWLAYRSVQFEGNFRPSRVEGQIPIELKGTLYRNGPGTKQNYGIALNHLFDGDAYLTAFKFEQGQILGRSAFLETQERLAERAANQMLYHDFGTKCPRTPKGFKNSPNIHVVDFGGKLMALSESSHPVEVDPVSLETKARWDYNGTLPKGVAFTAHPKIDPITGNGYTFGITQGIGPELKVYSFSAATGLLKLISSIDLNRYYLIHDMMVTENFLVFLIPPVFVDLMGAATLQAPVADLLNFESEKPLRIVVIPKNGSHEPLEFESAPGGTGFHHFNAYEENGNIIFDSILAPDMGILELVKSWSAPDLPKVQGGEITRFELDLQNLKVQRREVLSDGVPLDFPCVDPTLVGRKQQFVYALEAEYGTKDLLNTNGLVRWDLETRTPYRIKAEPQQIFGELVMHGNYLFNLGFDGLKDETFLDIRLKLSMELVARVWLGRYIPLGFHGSFV